MEFEWKKGRCYPNTRQNVIAFIANWLSETTPHGKPVLWLYGLAGSGKSTIATTIAEDMLNRGQLGAFFYFDRDQPGRNANGLIRTLVYKLAISNAEIGVVIDKIVDRIGDIPSTPLNFQFIELLSARALQAITWNGDPLVFVIDALDECGTLEDRESLLDAFSRGFSHLAPFIRILIVSRPEVDIRETFGSNLFVLPYELDIDSKENKEDIQNYFRVRLDKIRKRWACEETWPGGGTISILGQKSAGLMIWAETACLYINGLCPQDRLLELIGPDTIMVLSTPFSRLSNLYKVAIKSSGLWEDSSYASACCSMLGMIVCARIPLSSSAIGAIMSIPIAQILSASGFGCLLQLSKTQPIRVLHPSFQDYLTLQALDEPWFIDIQKHNQEIALQCMHYIKSNLHDNISGLSLAQQHWVPWLPEALCYACRYWIEHLVVLESPGDHIRDIISDLLNEHLIHWIEALAFLKEHSRTIHLLNNFLNWTKVRYSTSIKLTFF